MGDRVISTAPPVERMTGMADTQANDGRSEQAQAEQAALEARVLQAAQYDLQQFSYIYDRYFPRIYAYCLRRVGSSQEAEDLSSQIFTRAMVNLEQYRGGFVAAWLFRIAHNVVYTHSVSQRNEVSYEALSAEMEAEIENPLDLLAQAEDSRIIQQMVEQLPGDQQQLLRMKLVDGLSSERIGAILGKTAGSVRVTLHRILRRLYTEYEGDSRRG